MKILVIKIEGTKNLLIRANTLDERNNYKWKLGDKELSREFVRSEIVINEEDNLQWYSSTPEIEKYVRGEEEMTVKEYKSFKQHYWDDDEDDQVIQAIANKKKLAGFEPVREKPQYQKVEFEIIGYIKDTGSDFISCTVTGKYKSDAVLFTVRGNSIVMDEYDKLKEQYKDHATFYISFDRGYLRFAKINGNFAFSDSYPFNDFPYLTNHTSLQEAQEKEKELRTLTKAAIDRAVFKKDLTEHKRVQVIAGLKNARKMKTKKGMEELLDILIADMEYYHSINQ